MGTHLLVPKSISIQKGFCFGQAGRRSVILFAQRWIFIRLSHFNVFGVTGRTIGREREICLDKIANTIMKCSHCTALYALNGCRECQCRFWKVLMERDAGSPATGPSKLTLFIVAWDITFSCTWLGAGFGSNTGQKLEQESYNKPKYPKIPFKSISLTFEVKTKSFSLSQLT